MHWLIPNNLIKHETIYVICDQCDSLRFKFKQNLEVYKVTYCSNDSANIERKLMVRHRFFFFSNDGTEQLAV